MSVTTSSWEHTLISRAQEALESYIPTEPVRADEGVLGNAYAFCDGLTRIHSRTFHMASGLLPASCRQAVRALYAFCRVSDDLVDEGAADARSRLEDWRHRALHSVPKRDDLVSLAFADTRARYHIPVQYAEQLIDGVARDLVPTRYGSFDELAAYCYGVASTVGLMSMHIIGFAGPEAIPYAVKLGVALQLTNILRDVGEDWAMGRLYLPLDELAEFGLSEQDIAKGCTDSRWQSFLRFQISRNRRLYREALPGIGMLQASGRFAIAAAAELYEAILNDIEMHCGDVFCRRAHVDRVGKMLRLPGIWWRSTTNAYGRAMVQGRA